MLLRVHFRRIYRLVLLAWHTAWGVVLVLTMSYVQSPARWDRTISRWSARMLKILGVRLSVASQTQDLGRALLVANHVSWLDIFVIHAARRVHFVSKSEVRHWPVAGWLAWKSGTLFVERNRRADTLRINREMRAILEKGGWVAVFPEGTTSNGRQLRRFLPSLLQPAVDLSLPVVPAALRYRDAAGNHSDAVCYIDDLSFTESLWKIAGEKSIHARIEFGDPVGGTDRRSLAVAAQAEVAKLLGLSPTDTPPGSADDLPGAAR
jgi:1-acyl-sn-glycerol-3-phosphate acyltransferase